MTVLVVPLLGGRSLEEWTQWIINRVKENVGYPTPDTLPQLYAQSRLVAFRARREAIDARERQRQEGGNDLMSNNTFITPSSLSAFARVLSSTSGLTFSPTGGIQGGLMFGGDDSDEEEDTDDEVRMSFMDSTKTLKDQLAQMDHDSDDDQDLHAHIDDGATTDHFETAQVDLDVLEAQLPAVTGSSPSGTPFSHVQDETPPPPSGSLQNGDAKPVEQLESVPGGDAAPDVVKADGLMDISEDPLKA